MRFSEMTSQVTWSQVIATFEALYPHRARYIARYERIYRLLRQTSVAELEIEIVLAPYQDLEDGGKNYIDVFGQRTWIAGADFPTRIALEFWPWSDWLGMSIAEETMQNFTETQIICHCLYEMTFFGYTEATIQQRLAE